MDIFCMIFLVDGTCAENGNCSRKNRSAFCLGLYLSLTVCLSTLCISHTLPVNSRCMSASQLSVCHSPPPLSVSIAQKKRKKINNQIASPQKNTRPALFRTHVERCEETLSTAQSSLAQEKEKEKRKHAAQTPAPKPRRLLLGCFCRSTGRTRARHWWSWSRLWRTISLPL